MDFTSERVNFGSLSIPLIGMGTFGSDKYLPEQVSSAVKAAVKVGYRLFDCASVYGNEGQIGGILRDEMREGNVSRDELFIISKVWNDMHGDGDVLLSCKKSLWDLKLDYFDLYFVHWPFPNYHKPGCGIDARNPNSRPFFIEEFMSVWRQMEQLVDMGLVKAIAVSNMTIPKLEAVLPRCRILPAAHEMELHPAFQQPEIFDYCVKNNILPIGYCPIGSPNRPERDRSDTDINVTQMPEIVSIAKAHGIHPVSVCLKWAVQRGQIPIPFASQSKNIKNNIKCIFEEPLSDDEMETIKNADRNNRLVKGHAFLWPSASDWHALWDENGLICGWND